MNRGEGGVGEFDRDFDRGIGEFDRDFDRGIGEFDRDFDRGIGEFDCDFDRDHSAKLDSTGAPVFQDVEHVPENHDGMSEYAPRLLRMLNFPKGVIQTWETMTWGC